jgi:2-hydroxy fatty acid dioxygenase
MSKTSKGIFDFVGQLSFYGEYHANPANKAVHIVGVPTIAWSVLVWLTYFGALVEAPSFLRFPDYLIISPAYVLVALYSTYYCMLEPVAGLCAATLFHVLWFAASAFFAAYPEDAMKIATVAHVAGWIAQFVGHGVAEKRKPALMDNLFQSIVLAPLFVVVEVLFMLGYRPQLAQQFEVEVQRRIAVWKSSSSDKKAE